MITGLEAYYYKVCHRKLWYFARQLRMEAENEDVRIGKVIDETSYRGQEKGFRINNEIHIDFVHRNHVVHEVKKSRKVEEASVFQLKYYLYYLEQLGVECASGELDYPLLKRTVIVVLNEGDRGEIERAIADVERIKQSSTPPALRKMKICAKCAYHDYCFISD